MFHWRVTLLIWSLWSMARLNKSLTHTLFITRWNPYFVWEIWELQLCLYPPTTRYSYIVSHLKKKACEMPVNLFQFCVMNRPSSQWRMNLMTRNLPWWMSPEPNRKCTSTHPLRKVWKMSASEEHFFVETTKIALRIILHIIAYMCLCRVEWS